MSSVATTPSETQAAAGQADPKPEPKAIEQAKPQTLRIVTQDDSQFANLLDTAKFEHMWRVATIYAASKIVPAHYQGERENCFIAVQMAVRLGVDPFMFMQKTYVVGGKPGMEAQLAIALVNARGPFNGAIQWKLEGEGMTRRATAFATHKETGELCFCTVSMEIAQAEGWLGKSGSKWKTMPDQMLRYRSAAWLARLYAPECLMGMQTLDELQDTNEEPRTLEAIPAGRASFRAPDVVAETTASELVDKNTGEVESAEDAAAKAKVAEQAAALKADATPEGDCYPGRSGCSTEEPRNYKTIDGHKRCAKHAAAPAAASDGTLPGMSETKGRRKL